MHSELLEKRSFNGFPSQPHQPGQSLASPNLSTSGAFSGVHLLSPVPRQSLRRCRSASPAPHRKEASGGSQLLSPEQQTLIRKSWLKIPKGTFGKAVIDQMIETYPAVSRLFESDASAISRHERYFSELAQWAVDSVAEPERTLGPWLEMVGRGHVQFSVKRTHWDSLGEALTDAICQWMPPGRQRRETVHAWRVLLSFLSDRLGTSSSASHQQGAPHFSPRIELLQLVADGPPTGRSAEQKPSPSP